MRKVGIILALCSISFIKRLSCILHGTGETSGKNGVVRVSILHLVISSVEEIRLLIRDRIVSKAH